MSNVTPIHWLQHWHSSPPQISDAATLKGCVSIHINSVNIDVNPLEIRSGNFDVLISSYDFRLRAFHLIHFFSRFFSERCCGIAISLHAVNWRGSWKTILVLVDLFWKDSSIQEVLILPKRNIFIGRGRVCTTDPLHRYVPVYCLIATGCKFTGKQSTCWVKRI